MLSVQFPTPATRLSWVRHGAFVREVLMQLEANGDSFTPLTKLDELLHPADATKTIGDLLPGTTAWSPQVGIAIAHALHIAVVASIKRMAVRYLDVADSTGAAGEDAVHSLSLVTSKPIDRYVGSALCAPRAVTIEPLDTRASKAARGKQVGLRPVTLSWEGARDPRLWNWVRAEAPADATAEEVAAKLWTVTDNHGDKQASFNAYLLAAAAPLFGIPKRFAIQNPNAKQYAPARALAGDDSVEAQLVQVAGSKAADDAARAGAPPATTGAAGTPELATVLTSFGDCSLQLKHLVKELTPWGTAEQVAPALAFVRRKQVELPTADPKQLGPWSRVVDGQKDRLSRIGKGVGDLVVAAEKLAIKDRRSEQAAPVREILELFSVAAGTSHIAAASEAKLVQALQMQAGLSVRALQATEGTMMGAVREVHQQAGDNQHTGALSSQAIKLQQRSRELQAQMLNGQEIDADEVDDVALRSDEISLESKLYGTLDAVADLNKAARAAREGDAAIIASLFSGKFRDLPSVTRHIFEAIAPIRNNWNGARSALEQDARLPGSPARKAQTRADRRAALASAQSKFATVAKDKDKDLENFFAKAMKLIEDQQFRSVSEQAA